VADKSTQLVLDALGRAVAEPGGWPLHGGKTSPGLFPTTAPGKLAAQRCKDDGLLRVVRTETRSKVVLETCAITEKGLEFLVNQASPKQVLEDLVRTLEGRRGQVDELVATAQQTRAHFAALQAAAERVLQHLHQAPPPGTYPEPPAAEPAWTGALLDHLTRWQASRQAEDCPLPELFARTGAAAPGLTIGRFHDGLRQLHDQEHIYLHPWTGPLHALPEPPYALLVGHEIAYYASRRCA
jgi:hypothetical protein